MIITTNNAIYNDYNHISWQICRFLCPLKKIVRTVLLISNHNIF